VQLWHSCALFELQALPDWPVPWLHVHCFVAHWRFCVLLGATVWY
jgi:hypothetical protein